jgi:dTDP-4-dehydrorhamnose reductase
MRVWITGTRGRLGRRLTNALERAHDVIATGSSDLDVTDFKAVGRFAREARPDLVIHTAAWTDVDGCAQAPERAVLVNGFGAQHVALAAAAVGAALVYISTNEVFDGRSRQPYREYDAANPINPYGYSKWVGERAVMSLNPRHYIVRTSWVFAHGGKNFVQTILSAAGAGKSLRVVTNEIACPTYNDDLADAIAALIQTERFGIYHFTNAGACSRWQFARYILDRTGYTDTPIAPILSHQWQRPSTPPLYTPLANHAGRLIGIELRTWQAAVDAFLEREGLLV